MIVSASRVTYPIQADDSQVVEPHFSWTPCDYQGSNQCNLGGDRYDIEYYDDLKDNDLKYMTVCVDCYYLLMTGERQDDYDYNA
jgi:hypothetical protein